MGLSFTEVTPETFTTSGLTCSSGAFTPTPGALLVVHVSTYLNNANGTLSNTGTTLTWTLRRNEVSGGAADRALRVYTATVPASVSSTVITHTLTGASAAMVMAVTEVVGQAVSPVVQVTGLNSAASSIGGVSATGVQVNNAYIAALGRAISKAATLTSTPSGYTHQGELAAGTGGTNGVAQSVVHRVGGEGANPSLVWTFSTGVDSAATFVEIAPSPGLTIKMQNYEGG